MTNKYMILLVAVVAVGVISPAFAVSMEDVTHVVYGDELFHVGDMDTNAVIHFTGNPDGLKGFELYDKSLAPNTSNCQSGWNADEYSVCVFETKNMELGYHEWFDRTTDTWGKFYIMESAPAEPIAESAPVTGSTVGINYGAALPTCADTDACITPSTITIKVGDTLTWKNDDAAPHRLVSGTPENGPDGIFDTGILVGGANGGTPITTSFSHTFLQAGEFQYFDMINPWIQGTVIVEE